MSSNNLRIIPQAQKGNTGWPWTEEILPIPQTMPDGSPWPKISIVTPSYNQGQFLEETIRSVLMQGYPNLEYIIIDGCSTDGSVGIIKKYEPWLTYWVSEKDTGQAEAINKGFAHAKGQILSWINSDDLLMPGALKQAVQYFIDHPQVDMIFGSARILGDDGIVLAVWRPQDFEIQTFLCEDYICQPASFFRSRAYKDVGGLRTDLHYALDYDLWLRLALDHVIKRVDPILGADRKQRNAKTMIGADLLVKEKIKVVQEFFDRQKILPEIASLQPRVMAIHNLNGALDFLSQRKMDEMITCIQKANLLDPTFNPSTEDWVKFVVQHAVRDSASDPDTFIMNAELACRPIFGDYSRDWNKIRRRARLVSLTRGRMRSPYFSILRDIFLVILTNPGWSLNRRLLADLIRLILGDRLFRSIIRNKSIAISR